MEERSLAVRILGVAATSHGFAYAVTEGSEHLVDWARHRATSQRGLRSRLEKLVDECRPLFIASEFERNERSRRGREFNAALRSACEQDGIMILGIGREVVFKPGRGVRPVTNHEIAKAAAKHFPHLRDKVPQKRRSWDGSDDRVGILLAAAFAVTGWNHFRKRSH